MPNSYETRPVSDNRDDYADDDPGVITVDDGRIGLNQYSDNDSDDADTDCEMTHNRRNTRSLPSNVPDPHFKKVF